MSSGSQIVGTLAPNLFIFASMINDYRSVGKVHRVYLWGAPATMALVGGAFLLVMTPAGEVVKTRPRRSRSLPEAFVAEDYSRGAMLSADGTRQI